MILRLSLDLPDDRAYMSTTRLLGRTLLENQKVVRSDIDDTVAIIDELCTNVVRHAHSQNHCFTVIIEYYTEWLAIDVVDHGRGIAPGDARAMGASRIDLDGGERIGGFGMPMVRALSDKLEFRSTNPHGTTVHAEKRLRYESAADKNDAARLEQACARGVVAL